MTPYSILQSSHREKNITGFENGYDNYIYFFICQINKQIFDTDDGFTKPSHAQTNSGKKKSA